MRVSVSLVFATLLCFTTWMNSDHKPHMPLGMCCLSWSKTKIPLTRIANYTIQSEGICPIAAIRFVTTIGKIICSDPDSGWAKKAKLKVDKEERKNKLPENGQNDEGATSNITPATVTTSTYTMQRFHTNTGGTICSDQDGDCAKEDVLKVDEEDRKNTLLENGQNDEEASGDIEPATVTTSTYITQSRENGQNYEGATSDITTATATTSTYTTVTCASGVCSGHVTTTQRFRTTTGGTICSDQNGDCAKEDVLKVDEEDRNYTLQENIQNDEEATSDITPATVTTSTHTMQRENRQNDEGATSDITAATATTSKLHLTEKPKVQWENGPKTFCLRNHNTSHSYHSQQTLLFTVVLLLLYCINSKHM